MLIDAPLTLPNTIMHHKHLSHLMAKSMNELAHKSPLITYVLGLNYVIFFGSLAANSLHWKCFQVHDVWILILVICALHFSLLRQTISAFCRAAKKLFNFLLSEWFWI